MESELSEDEINVLEGIYIQNNIKKPKYSKKYYDLFVNNKIFVPSVTSVTSVQNGMTLSEAKRSVNESNTKQRKQIGEEYYHLGCYYDIRNDYNYFEMMIKNLTMASSYGNIEAMMELVILYSFFHKDQDKVKKFLLMAINKGSIRTLLRLGDYYADEENNMKIAYYYYFLYIKSKPKKISKAITSINNYTGENISITDTNILEIYNMIGNIINLICSGNIKPDELVCLMEGVFRILNLPEIPNDNGKIKNLDKFLVLIYKIINGKNKKMKLKPNADIIKQMSEIVNKYKIKINANKLLKMKYKKYVDDKYEIKINVSEVLKMKYEEYLDDKYAPGGKGYFKAKKDFEKRSNGE
jgi:hypothetical protein